MSALEASFAETILVPAASKSLSRMPAFTPAPFSTATSAPKPARRFTVSGVAATRVSPESASAGIPIFMARFVGSGQENEHADQHDNDRSRSVFHHPQEALVGFLVLLVIVARRRRVFRSAMVSHRNPLQNQCVRLVYQRCLPRKD